MMPSGDKNGDIHLSQRAFDRPGSGHGSNHSNAHGPWWNPKYWRKRVWVAVVVVFLGLVVAVPVAVTQTRRSNAYPDYTELSYTLRETCEDCLPSCSPLTQS